MVVPIRLLPYCLVQKNKNGMASRLWKKFDVCITISAEYRHVMDEQTDILWQHSLRYAYALRGKDCLPAALHSIHLSICLSIACAVYWMYGNTVPFSWWRPAVVMASTQQHACNVSLCSLPGRAAIISASIRLTLLNNTHMVDVTCPWHRK